MFQGVWRRQVKEQSKIGKAEILFAIWPTEQAEFLPRTTQRRRRGRRMPSFIRSPWWAVLLRRQAALRLGQLLILRQQPVVSWSLLPSKLLLSALSYSQLSCQLPSASASWVPSRQPPSISAFEPISSLLRFVLWAWAFPL